MQFKDNMQQQQQQKCRGGRSVIRISGRAQVHALVAAFAFAGNGSTQIKEPNAMSHSAHSAQRELATGHTMRTS